MPADLETVFLARHGETTWNLERRRQGQLNSPLTDRGHAQAEAIGKALVDQGIDGVFHSPLGRAAETAAIVADALGLTPLSMDDLAEVHHGDMAGLTAAEIEHQFPGALTARKRAKYAWRFPQGESYADAEVRAERAWFAVQASGLHRPLLVSHEMIGRMLLKRLLDFSVDDALLESHPHDRVHVVELTTGTRTSISVNRIE